MTRPEIQKASIGDREEIQRILKEADLPLAGVDAHLEDFLVARESGAIVGAIGLEVYGTNGLLRSLAVRPSSRSRGIANALYLHLVEQARLLGVQRLILLTTTAEYYFAARGFHRIDRSAVAGELTASEEFGGACPTSAICMERIL
jgi:amino-acid N-acetyltransferase